MNVSETVKRITELQLCGSDSRAQSYNEGLKAAIHILESCEQPQLNENQQIVLEWLKNIYNSPIIINPIAVVFSLHNELVKDSEIDAVEAYAELGFDEEIQVLEVFTQWAKKQEDQQ